jgi:hypothetical protein
MTARFTQITRTCTILSKNLSCRRWITVSVLVILVTAKDAPAVMAHFSVIQEFSAAVMAFLQMTDPQSRIVISGLHTYFSGIVFAHRPDVIYLYRFCSESKMYNPYHSLFYWRQEQHLKKSPDNSTIV